MYTVSKTKYFSKKDIDDLNVFLKTLEEYIKKMELKQNFENKIKYNLENIEIDNKTHNKYNKEKGMKDIIILLDV